MVKYLSGRKKRRPQDKLTEDRYQYLGLEQAEPNLADPATSPGVPAGAQFQLIAVSGYDGKRYWVPVGGELQPGSITIFDEGSQVSGTSSITQLNFVGAAVTAVASVQSPSGHPGVAATVTVIPVTVGDNPPIGAGTTNNGELWWESDTGDLYVYYNDGDSSQWVMANSGGRGLTGDKGTQGDKGIKGSKGEIGSTGSEGDKGSKGEPSTVKGDKGDKGDAIKGDKGDAIKGDKGDAIKGDKGEMNVINSNADDRVITGSDTVGELNAESKLTFDSDNVTATLNVTGNTYITGITTINNNLNVNGDIDVDGHTNLDNVSVSGVSTFAGNVRLLDNIELQLGTDGSTSNGDLRIFHDGSESKIWDNGEGGLVLQTGGSPIELRALQSPDEIMLKATPGGSVDLYEDGTLRFKTTDNGVRIYGGLQDKDGDIGTSGQVLTSTGTELNWVPASTIGGSVDTTYDLITSSSGSNVQLLLDASSGDDDPILITAGTNVSFGGVSATGFTINTVDTNTTYDLVTSTSGSNIKLKLDASTGASDDDEITITAGTNVTLTDNSNGGFTIDATNTNTQLTTEEVQDIVGAMFSGNTETRISASYQDGDGTIDLVVDDMTSDNNTTYDLLAIQTGGNNDNPSIKLDASSGDDDEIQIVGGTNVTVTRNSDSQITISSTDTNTNTQLSTEQVQDIVGAMFSGNTETRISASYQDGDGTIDLVVDDMTSDNNTTYDLSVPGSTTNIRLAGSDSTNDDITITGGNNITVTRTSATELNIASSANIDVTQLDLNRIRFGPGNAINDDANIEWLGGNNAGYLRISTSDDSGTEYIELGDYDQQDITGSFTQWMKLNRTELYMARDVRLNAALEDKDGQKGSNGQVLVSTGSQVNWVNASTVGGSVDNYADSLSFSSGTLTLGRTGSLSDLTTTIPLSGITGNFTDLDDTPANYSGAANKYVKVNGSANGLTFVTASTVGGDISYNDLQNLPSLFDGNYNSLSNQPSLFDGNYNSLSNQPSIPTNNNQLTNGAGYITSFTNTTYDLSVLSGTTKIRLSGSNSTNDDVEIAAGSGISVTRNNANKLTITNTDGGSSVTGGTTRTIIRAYGSSSQYSPTSGTKFIQVYCVAGGGGSGRAIGDTSGEQDATGATGGGGGGGACIGYYNITGSFSASIQVGGGGQGGPQNGQPAGGSSGGESKFTPSGSYTGNGTLDANGGQPSGTGAGPGGGGGASGGFALTGDNGQRIGNSQSAGSVRQTPGKGGLAAYNFGIYGRGGNGSGPTGGEQAGQAGQSGVVVVYEYLT